MELHDLVKDAPTNVPKLLVIVKDCITPMDVGDVRHTPYIFENAENVTVVNDELSFIHLYQSIVAELSPLY